MLNIKMIYDWVKHCMMWEVEGIKREDAGRRHGGIVLKMIWTWKF